MNVLQPHVSDVGKWKRQFEREREGRPSKKSRKGLNFLEPLTGGADAKIKLVTPTAQATEQAESDLKRMKTATSGVIKKKKRSINKGVSKKRTTHRSKVGGRGRKKNKRRKKLKISSI